MKLLITQAPKRHGSQPVPPGDEVLRLAAEIFEDNGQWPAIDVAAARLSHWNGHQIALARSDLDALTARGLLEPSGRWSALGLRELARCAALEASAA